MWLVVLGRPHPEKSSQGFIHSTRPGSHGQTFVPLAEQGRQRQGAQAKSVERQLPLSGGRGAVAQRCCGWLEGWAGMN